MGGTSSKPSKSDNDSKHSKNISSSSSASKPEAKDPKSEAVTIYQGKLGEAAPVESVNFKDVDTIISAYHANYFDVDEKRFTQEHCQDFTLFGKNAMAARLGHCILHGRRTEALTIAKQHPDLLDVDILANDPLRRKAYGKPLRLAAASGQHTLVRDFIALFREQKCEEEAFKQLQAQFPDGWEDRTASRMDKQYLVPLGKFIDSLAEAKLSSRVQTFEQAVTVCKPIIRQYITDISKRTDPVFEGLMVDSDLYPRAYQLISDNQERIRGGWASFETGLMFAIGYQSLFGASNAFIAQILISGANKYFNEKIMPAEKLHFKDGVSFFSLDPLVGIGKSFVVSYFDGGKYAGGHVRRCLRRLWRRLWETYVKQEHQYCRSYAAGQFIDAAQEIVELPRNNR